ncbi:MAG: helix-turn-helix domain-containing protein [Merismopedia sp. SIO2A8]|nr:helix-turn-helix domain-containing protein [Symploca sp. SIO2B6]NET51307.1 helix-turn-helix domain-containing protein [Merismopedia sp. SIO2A8]
MLSVEIIISYLNYDGKEYGCIWSRDITARKQLEIALKKAHQLLECRFEERTAQLKEVNEQLCREIAERQRAEVELKKQVALSHRCVVELQQVSEPPLTETESPSASQSLFPNCPQLSEVFNFIENNYQQPIGLGDVAKAVGYSPAYLTDLVRRLTGQTVYRWIAERRMTAACSLLQETDQTIDQIAKSVGYRYAVCFFRQFRQSFGMTPQVWRNAQRESEAID